MVLLRLKFEQVSDGESETGGRTAREFQDVSAGRGNNAPRFQFRDDLDDAEFLIHANDINGKAHKKSMDG